MGQRRRRSFRGPHSKSLRRPLRLEPLEDRRLLALTVTTNLDIVDLNDGVLSLREAIFVANTVAGPEEINFDFGHDGPETIVLTQGELVITDSLTITGAGAALLTIDASGSDPTPEANNGDGSRVFLVDDGVKSNRFSVEIRGMTLTGGDTNDLRGGAIHSREHLTVRESVITGNSVYVPSDNPTSGWGGGIQVLYGNLQVIDSVISNNSARRAGGGIDFNPVGYDAALTIANSMITGNFSRVDGGGVLVAGDTTITDSKIENNVAFQKGGGIAVWSNSEAATLVVEDSEITGNRAGRGGGIYSSASAVRVRVTESLIADNRATDRGGGIAMSWNSAPATNGTTPLEIVGSTLSGNRADFDGNALDLRGQYYTGSAGQGMAATISASTFSNNLGGNELNRGSVILAIAERLTISDAIIQGEEQTGIEFRSNRNSNPGLELSHTEITAGGRGLHAFNANVTVNDSEIAGHRGHGIELSNSALVVEDSSIRNNLRGIHAYNSQLTVTSSTIDGNKGQSTGGGIFLDRGSLQVTESTISNNVSSWGGGITFAGQNLGPLLITASTIRDNVGWLGGGVMTDGPTTIVDSQVIDNRARDGGGGILARDRLEVLRSVVSGNQTTGTNRAGGGIYAVDGDLAIIVDSSVSNNVAMGRGGGIQSNVPLQVRRSNISDNISLNQGGGGISVISRPLSLIDSTVSGNRAAGANAPGGGIRGGIVTIDQSTISNNRTEGLTSPGGGVNGSQLSLRQSTVADNEAVGADSLGGGLFVSGPLTLTGSIVADNTAGGGNPDLRVNSIAAANYSLIGNTAGLTAPQLNSINLGTGNQPDADPQLGPLAYNGGPTFADGTRMKTHSLLVGSPAIDAGDPAMTGPVAMYRFEEATGAMIADDLVGGNDGTYHGDPVLGQPGAPLAGGAGAEFDGVDDFVTIPRTVADNFTISMWVRTTQSVSGPAGAGLIGGNAEGNSDFQVLLFSGRVALEVGGVPIVAARTINNGNWHHVAVTRNAAIGARAVYVDGDQGVVALGGMTGSLDAATELHVGELLSGMGRFAGAIDELALYDRVLSTAEIEQLAAGSPSLFDQRGEPHLRVLDGDEPDDIAIDIGSYERELGETYNFVVDTVADESDGDYSAGDFSLREAIELANANPGADAIEFHPALWAEGPATIVLMMGYLHVQDAVNIHGPGAELLTIDAAGSDPTPDSTLDDEDDTNDGDGTTAFIVSDDDYEDRFDVQLAGIMITGGDSPGAGAISSSEALRLVDAVVSGNRSTNQGGAIDQSGGVLTIVDSVISDNESRNQGSGISVFGGSLILSGSVVSNNTTGDEFGSGGSVHVNNLNVDPGPDAFVRIEQSVISQNVARGPFGAGGIAVLGDLFRNSTDVTIAGSTISENTASGNVAGIYLHQVNATIKDSTISSNRWAFGGGLGGIEMLRGGIYLSTSELVLVRSSVVDNLGRRDTAIPAGNGIHVSEGSTLLLDHSIVARNQWTVDLPNPVDVVVEFGTAAASSSLIGAAAGVVDEGGSLIGTAAEPIDPMLGPLRYNGGPVFADGTRMLTHAPLPGSPVIDVGFPPIGDLKSLYQFGEATGSTAIDSVGGFDGMIHGDPILGVPSVIGQLGGAIQLDGADDFVSIPRTVADDFSFAFWINTSQASGSWGVVGGDVAGASNDFSLLISGGRVEFRVADRQTVSNTAVNDGQWHHVAVTRDFAANRSKIYIDGREDVFFSNAPFESISLTAATELYIGQKLAGDGHLAGLIDEFAVYDRVLKASEVYQLATPALPEFDQRGVPWSRVAGGRIDMGAVEWQLNPLPADYNFNGVVDAADYSVWRDTVGSTTDLRADGSSEAMAGVPDGVVDAHDYAWWKANFGNVYLDGAGSRGQGAGTESTAEQVSSGGQVLAAEQRLADVGEGGGAGNFVPLAHELTFQVGPARRSSAAVEIARSGRTVGIDAALLAWVESQRLRSDVDSSDSKLAIDLSDSDRECCDCETLDLVFADTDSGW